MGKKLLIASVLIVTILFGLIFWKVNEADHVAHKPVVKNIHKNLSEVEVEKSDAGVETLASVNTVQQTVPEQNLSELDTPQTVEQVAPAAFGFLQQKELLQVVGLLSEHDKSGSLMAYIDQLCQQKTCSVDVSYRTDIIDAKWQDDVVGILKLFIAQGVEHGSLFIQANGINLEGKVVDAKSADELQKYLSHLKEEGIKVQNHCPIDAVTENQNAEETEKLAEIVPAQPLAKETEESNLSKEPGDIAKPDSSIKSAVKAEQAKVQKKQTVPEKTVRAKKVSQKKVQKSYAKKHRVKKVHKVRKKPEQDIIAPSYMETSIDLERKIKGRIKGQEESADFVNEEDQDIVAKPRLEILY